MVAGGLRDILIANQVVGSRKIGRLVQIAALAAITVAVDDPDNVGELGAACRAAGCTVGVLVEVDVGMAERASARLSMYTPGTAGRADGGPALPWLMGYEGTSSISRSSRSGSMAFRETWGN